MCTDFILHFKNVWLSMLHSYFLTQNILPENIFTYSVMFLFNLPMQITCVFLGEKYLEV